MLFGKQSIKSCLSVINTCSGAREGHSIYESALQQHLDRCGVVHREVLIPKYDVNNALHAYLQQADCLVVCGGDGTVSSVANALGATQQEEFLRKPIAVVPAGLQNSIAHSFGMISPERSLSSLIMGRTDAVPLWEVRVNTAPSLVRYVCSYVAVGAYASIVQRFHQLSQVGDEYFALPMLRHRFHAAALYTAFKRDVVPCAVNLKTHTGLPSTQNVTAIEGAGICVLRHRGPLWLLIAAQMPLQHGGYSLTPCATYKRGTLSATVVTPEATRLRMWHLLSREAKEGHVLEEDGVHIHQDLTYLQIHYDPILYGSSGARQEGLDKVSCGGRESVGAPSKEDFEHSLLLMLDGEETWVLPGATVTIQKSTRSLNFLVC
ncbi:unnamed protein product [Phytomonas sp. Hart1]|nr:unnamed protein product [Phytomonas sp. Hart1]|eukprot:CCW67949.1 unnamed protein product [Phytomonas sp. isolate Hart1]